MDIGDVIASRFELVETVARGGMGTVFRAIERQTGESVAVKVLSDRSGTSVERFHQEVELLAKLTHPHIVRYVCHGCTPAGELFLVQEWIAGPTMAEYLSQTGMTVRDAVIVIRQVARALSAAHARRIIHRDIKPDNLMLEHRQIERVKVLDFGIARPGYREHRLTQTGTMLGTPGYMAPEQALGTHRVDARVDIFALGCILYECLTGRHAFPGDNALAIRAKLLLCEPAPVSVYSPEAPPVLVELVARMMAKEPSDRPASMTQILAALDQIPDIEAGVVRRLGHGESATLRVARTDTRGPGTAAVENVTCVVMAVSTEESGLARAATEARQYLETVQAAVRACRGRISVLDNGSVLFACDSSLSASEQACTAAEAALALRAVIPNSVVAVSSSQASGAEDAIDRGALTLHDMRMRSIFTDFLHDTPNEGVRLDELTASLIGDTLDVQRDASGIWLYAHDSPAPN